MKINYRTHTCSIYSIFHPSIYLNNPNLYSVIEVFHAEYTFETIKNYLDDDLTENCKLFLKEKGIETEDPFSENLEDFFDDYPYNYFFIELENIDLDFREKNIFITELINLLDITEDKKKFMFDNTMKYDCFIVKLRHRLRNILKQPIPDITILKQIANNVDFDEMYDNYL